jgi:hypothetical protein
MTKDWPVKAQTWVRDVCDMLIPLEAEVETFHASAAAFLRPQSSSLRDHQHPAGWDRTRLFDSERFKRKFVTTPADLRGEPGFRIVGYVLIPQGGISMTASQGVRALRQVAPFIIDAVIGTIRR